MIKCVCVCRSSTGRPDWTCVVVGFTSGHVRFYTEVPYKSFLGCDLPHFQIFSELKLKSSEFKCAAGCLSSERGSPPGSAAARGPCAEAQVSHVRDPSSSWSNWAGEALIEHAQWMKMLFRFWGTALHFGKDTYAFFVKIWMRRPLCDECGKWSHYPATLAQHPLVA